MKNLIRTIGIIALTAVIGFSMAACGGGDGEDPIVISGTLGTGAQASISIARAAVGATQIFRGEVQGDNSIAGKLEDGDMVFNLKGQYEPTTKAFTMQAASSVIVFSLSGKLNSSNAIDASASSATVSVKEGDAWTVTALSIAGSNQTISKTVTESGAAAMPSWSLGRWYDQVFGGVEVFVTENSITVFADKVYVSTVVEVETVEAGKSFKVLFSGIEMVDNQSTPSYTYSYVANSFDTTLSSAIGNVKLSDLAEWWKDMGDPDISKAVEGMDANAAKIFTTPYASNDSNKVLSTSGDFAFDGYSPYFKTASDAKAATDLKAHQNLTKGLMRTPPQP